MRYNTLTMDLWVIVASQLLMCKIDYTRVNNERGSNVLRSLWPIVTDSLIANKKSKLKS